MNNNPKNNMGTLTLDGNNRIIVTIAVNTRI